MQDANGQAEVESSAAPRVIYRHSLVVRITHWVNAACLLLLLMSGLQIFNAHPALYWGETSHFDSPFVAMRARPGDDGLRGITTVAGHEFDTTGIFGVSRAAGGELRDRGFPSWLTIPGWQALATGRRWHFFFAWLFVLNGIAFLVHSVASRHLSRDLVPTRRDWRGIGRSIADHVRLRKPAGEAATRYNVLQKLAYLGVVFVLGPLVLLMGLAMSPRMDTVLAWLLDAVGGRQSARTIHFLAAFAIVIFFAVHVFEVIVSGAINNMRGMITGRYRVPGKNSDA